MPSADDTSELLRHFAARRCEDAFRRLAERHTGMVLATARRMLHGNEAQAREVTQTVFVELARRAAALAPDVVLGAWLHRVTCAQAALLIRTEVRRRHREATAAAMNAPDNDDTAWSDIAPVLDAELNRLSAPDRTALVLRYLENRGLRDVGAALGTTEEGARKRVTRALEKLRARFVRQGLAAPGAAALAVMVGGQTTRAAEPEVIAAAARAGLTAPAAASGGFAAASVAGLLWKTAAVAGVAALGFTGGRATVPAAAPAPVVVPVPPPVPAVAKTRVAPRSSQLLTYLTAEDAMLARIARASAAELRTIFDDWNHDLSPPVFALLCQRWAALDLTGALHHLRHRDDNDSGISRFYGAWALAEFDAALASARKESGSWQNECVRRVLGSLLPRDGEKFLAQAALMEKPSHVSAEDVALAMRLATAGGHDKALAVFASFTAAHLRVPAARLLASMQAETDPDAAIAWAKSLTDEKERAAALHGAILAFVERDPDRAVPLLPLVPLEYETRGLALQVARAMVQRDGAAGLEWSLENLPPNRLAFSLHLLREAPALSAVARLHFAHRVRERLARESAGSEWQQSFDVGLKQSTLGHTSADPAAELRALAAEPADAIRNTMLGEIAFTMQRDDPQGLLQAVASLPADCQSLIAARVLYWSAGDPAAQLPLLALLREVPGLSGMMGFMKQNLTASAVLATYGERLAESAGRESFAALLAQAPAEQRPDIVRGAAGSFVRRDSSGTLAWAAALPAEQQIAATESIARTLAREDEMAVSQWIDALPHGAVRDAAAHGLCGPLAQTDPEAAWQWALSIGDDAVRVPALGTVYHQWAKKQQAEAGAALSSAPLNAAQRQTIQTFKP